MLMEMRRRSVASASWSSSLRLRGLIFSDAQLARLAERDLLRRLREALQPAHDREVHEHHGDHEGGEDHQQLPDAHHVERDVPERARGQADADDARDIAFLEPEAVLRP